MGVNAELVESLYEALERRDFDAAFELLAPDVVWSASNSRWPAAGIYHGHHGVREFWKRLGVALAEYTVEREPFVEAGDRVIVAVHLRVRRKRGRENVLEGDVADVWTLRDGLVRAVDVWAEPSGRGSAEGSHSG